MKKSLIALAVAGAMTAPMIAQADATLYGTAQFRLVDRDGADLDAQMAKTRLGVKGNVDNDIEGLTTYFGFEWEFNANAEAGTDPTDLDANGNLANDTDNYADTTINNAVSMRKSFVGMKGDFGSVIFGRQNNPAQAVEKASIMGRNDNDDIGDRVGNTLAYVSPKMNGVEAYLAVMMDGTSTTGAPFDANGEDLDGYTAGVNYSANGIAAALNYQEIDGGTGNDTDRLSLGVSYDMNGLYLAAQTVETDNGTTDLRDNTYAAKYAIDKTSLRVQYQDNTATDTNMLVLGAWYSLGAKASVGVEYADSDIANRDELVLEYTLSF